MKLLIIFAALAPLFAADPKADKFVDRYNKATRKERAILEEWQAHCKSKDMVPDITLGCVPPKPAAPAPVVEKPKEEPKK